MKNSLIAAIFMSLSILSTAQDLTNSVNLYAASETNTVELKLPIELLKDNLFSENTTSLIDKDRNSYTVIKIGTQVWMAENLKTTRFNDGTIIPVIYDYKLWSGLASPGYCWYNNDAGKYRSKYGVLYNGYAVSTGKLCPLGWHVPSIDEWLTLTNYSGNKMAGGNLKEIESWMSPNVGATNAIGFKALPGGSRGNRGSFLDIGLRGHWWSSTEYTSSEILNRTMSYSDSDVTGTSDHKESGLSVRCLKDN
jgi:uncharacterized protein (TIGR02145 family)